MIENIHRILEEIPLKYLQEKLAELYIAANNSDIADGWDKDERTAFAETVFGINRVFKELEKLQNKEQ